MWKAVKASKSGSKISHLFFADNLLLFGESSRKKMQVTTEILQSFRSDSGQKFNANKSKLFVSKNNSPELASQISNQLGIPLTADLGIYQGMHILRGRIYPEVYMSFWGLRSERGLVDGNVKYFPKRLDTFQGRIGMEGTPICGKEFYKGPKNSFREAVHGIWFWRNRRIHEPQQPHPPPDFVKEILQRDRELSQSLNKSNVNETSTATDHSSAHR